MRGHGVHELGERRAIEDGDIFDGPEAAQRGEAPGGLRTGAAVGVAVRFFGQVGRGEAVAGGGGEFDGDLAEMVGGRVGPGLAEEFVAQVAEGAEVSFAEMEILRVFGIGIDEDEQVVVAVRRLAEQRVHRRVERAEAGEFRAVEERGMMREEMIQAGEFGAEIVGAAPVQAAAGVDVHLFGGEPFHAAGEAEAAAHAGERAEAVAQERPGTTTRGEAVVVVGFAVVNHDADIAGLRAVIEITGNFRAGVILKQLGVRPLHAAFGEERFGGRP